MVDCWEADDWQFVDAASVEMANHMFAHVTPVATERWGKTAICAFCSDEVTDDFRTYVEELVSSGLGVHIELDALP